MGSWVSLASGPLDLEPPSGPARNTDDILDALSVAPGVRFTRLRSKVDAIRWLRQIGKQPFVILIDVIGPLDEDL